MKYINIVVLRVNDDSGSNDMGRRSVLALSFILILSIPRAHGAGFTVHLKSGKTLHVRNYEEKGDWYVFELLYGGQMHLYKDAVIKVEETDIDIPVAARDKSSGEGSHAKGKTQSTNKNPGDLSSSAPITIHPKKEGEAPLLPKHISKPGPSSEKDGKRKRRKLSDKEQLDRNRPPSVH